MSLNDFIRTAASQATLFTRVQNDSFQIPSNYASSQRHQQGSLVAPAIDRDAIEIDRDVFIHEDTIRAERDQTVLDAIAGLRAADDAYGPGDGYFGQPLKAVRVELSSLDSVQFTASVQRLIAGGYLQSSRHNPDLVWITKSGWLRWSDWNPEDAYLLRYEDSTD